MDSEGYKVYKKDLIYLLREEEWIVGVVVVKHSTLRWFGHLEKMNENKTTKEDMLSMKREDSVGVFEKWESESTRVCKDEVCGQHQLKALLLQSFSWWTSQRKVKTDKDRQSTQYAIYSQTYSKEKNTNSEWKDMICKYSGKTKS